MTNNNSIQIARTIYLEQLSTMKKILDLASFKFDKRTSEFKYFKSQIMDATFNGLKKLFKKLEQEKIIKKCDCGTNVRKGYRTCKCGGSGYCNV